MKNTRVINALAQKPQRQRAVLFGEVVDAEADLRWIAEDREPE